MKLYDYAGAPNPRRVKIFAAEKGIELDLVQTDMGKREHKTDDFIAKNPSGKIPVLELDDGTCIGESIAICRYLEAICPEPNLFGSTPIEAAIIEMHHRHVELELFSQVGTSWVNGPIVGKLFEGQIVQIPQAKDRSDGLTHEHYQRLDKAFGKNEYVAGERFTVADITTVVVIDFASALVDLKPDDSLAHLWGWHETVSARPSVKIQ
jgi:glutathione S-transferase